MPHSLGSQANNTFIIIFFFFINTFGLKLEVGAPLFINEKVFFCLEMISVKATLTKKHPHIVPLLSEVLIGVYRIAILGSFYVGPCGQRFSGEPCGFAQDNKFPVCDSHYTLLVFYPFCYIIANKNRKKFWKKMWFYFYEVWTQSLSW